MSNLSRIFISILLSFAFSIDYLDEIQPIFNASCVSCHNSDSQNYSNHQLDLTSYSGLMNGGESGDVITPYDASLSILYQEVSSGNMPQYGSGEFLVIEQINLIADWINDGALEEDESSSDPENWDCQYDSDCMEGEFCSIECFTGECGLDSSETLGALGQYCQPCDECQYPEDAVSGNCDSCGTSNDGGGDDDGGGGDGPPDCMAGCEGVENVDPDGDANAFCEWYMDAYQNTDCLDTCEGEYNLMIEQIYYMCEICLPTAYCDEMWDSEDCSGLDEYECDLNEDCIWNDYSMSCEECGCECLNSCGCEGNLDCEWNEENYTCEDSTTDGLPECWMDCENIDVIIDVNGDGTELCTWFIDTYNDENSCWDDCSDCGPEQNIYIQCETCLEMGEGMCDEWFSSSNECDELDEPDCEYSEGCTWNDDEMMCEEYTDENELEGECLDSDDCQDGLFCNMDHTSEEEITASFCEPCDYYSAIEDCYTDGLPEAGEAECADTCFGDDDLDNDLTIQYTYRIDNVYPNPFNPTTTVTYQIPEFSTISIDIYNMNGQLVENLYKGYKNPGKYSIEWTAENITSGAYLIKLVSGSFIETQKVMLVK